MVNSEQVILVDANDNQIGIAGKMEAHEKCLLHRAFSVFVFNDRGELLIQKRASNKYHSAGLWANTCCSHPHPGETILEAAHRRLKEEMGMECSLSTVFSFTYNIQLNNGLHEYELDHVVVGYCNSAPNPNMAEVSDWKFVQKELILQEFLEKPQIFAAWFPIAMRELIEKEMTLI